METMCPFVSPFFQRCTAVSLHYLLILLFSTFPVASALQNVTIPAHDPSINYQPSEGVWNAIGDSGASNGAFRLARTQGGFATISKSFRGFHFTSPLWPYPVKMTISIDSRTYMVDLQDYSAATTTPPLTGMLPSSKPSQILFSFHDTDAQRTVKVSSGSSSTGWTAVVESFIFEIAQPGDAPVSVSSSHPPPRPDDGNSGSINLENTPDLPSPTGSDTSGTTGISPQLGSTTLLPSASRLNMFGPIVKGSTRILDGVPGVSTTGSATRDSNHLNGLPTSVYNPLPPSSRGASPHSSDNPNPSTPSGPGTSLAPHPDRQHGQTIVIIIATICGTIAILAILLGLLHFRRRRDLLKDTPEKRLPVEDIYSGDVDDSPVEDEVGDPERAIRRVSGEEPSSSQNPFDDAYAENPWVFGDLDNASSISLARGDVIQHATRVSLISLRGSMRASIILAAPGVGYPPQSSTTNTAATISQTSHDHPSVEFSSTTEMLSNSELPPESTLLSVNSDSGIASLQLEGTRAPRRASIPPPLSLSPPSPPTPATAPPHYSQLSSWASSDDNSQHLALPTSIPSQGASLPIRHQPTRSQLSFATMTSLVTPLPKYCSTSGGCMWNEFGHRGEEHGLRVI